MERMMSSCSYFYKIIHIIANARNMVQYYTLTIIAKP